MKLHADHLTQQSVTAYGEGWLAINGQRHTTSLVLSSSGELFEWACTRFDELSQMHFDLLGNTGQPAPELVLFGSGSRLRFAHPALIKGLIDKGIGVETMDTPAACRTYNILAGEGRRVVAGLLQEN